MHEEKESKRSRLFLIGIVFLCIFGLIFTSTSAFATTSDEVVETNFFGNYTDDGEGCGVYMILNMVIDILSIGIAILGVIGVTLVGIQYMTAKDNEEKTRKAKNRMLEIVIGLVTYAALFAGVQWLLPGGLMSNKCHSVSDEKLAQMKEDEKKKNQAKQNKTTTKANEKKSKAQTKKEKQTEQQKNKAYKKCMERAAKVVRNDICKLETGAERVSETARLLAWPASQASNGYSGATSNYKKAAQQAGTSDLPGNACSGFVKTVLRASGLASDFGSSKGWNTACVNDYLDNSPNWKNIKTLKKKTPLPGDIAVWPKPCGCKCNDSGMGHTLVYVKSGGKTVTAQANYAKPRQYGVIKGKGNYQNSSNFNIYRYVGD